MYDVVIAGGGLVGISLALGLNALNLDLKIIIIEAGNNKKNINIKNKYNNIDQRSLALNLGSIKFLDKLGVWQELKDYSTPVLNINVSKQNNWSKIRFSAQELAVPALGYIIAFDKLQEILINKLNQNNNIDIKYNNKINNINYNNKIILDLENNEQVTSELLIISDGGNSKTRELVNINNEVRDYNHGAMVGNIQHSLRHDNTAFERFIKSGFLALLPLNLNNTSAFIFGISKEKYLEWENLDNKIKLNTLQKIFGYKLGDFEKFGTTQWFGLSQISASELVKDRVVVLGNAANQLHPLAGQGFNLGLRDVKKLIELINKYKNYNNNFDLGSRVLLSEYAQARKFDQNYTKNLTHNLITKSFLINNLSFILFDNLSLIKQNFAFKSTGIL